MEDKLKGAGVIYKDGKVILPDGKEYEIDIEKCMENKMPKVIGIENNILMLSDGSAIRIGDDGSTSYYATSPTKVEEKWKEVKNAVGELLNYLDNLYKGAGEASKIYDMGYKEGVKDAMESKLCKDCNKMKFWEECVGIFPIIKKYLALNIDDIAAVNTIINSLYCKVSKEEIEEGDLNI